MLHLLKSTRIRVNATLFANGAENKSLECVVLRGNATNVACLLWSNMHRVLYYRYTMCTVYIPYIMYSIQALTFVVTCMCTVVSFPWFWYWFDTTISKSGSRIRLILMYIEYHLTIYRVAQSHCRGTLDNHYSTTAKAKQIKLCSFSPCPFLSRSAKFYYNRLSRHRDVPI